MSVTIRPESGDSRGLANAGYIPKSAQDALVEWCEWRHDRTVRRAGPTGWYSGPGSDDNEARDARIVRLSTSARIVDEAIVEAVAEWKPALRHRRRIPLPSREFATLDLRMAVLWRIAACEPAYLRSQFEGYVDAFERLINAVWHNGTRELDASIYRPEQRLCWELAQAHILRQVAGHIEAFKKGQE